VTPCREALRHQEACLLDIQSSEHCCLPGAEILDVTERLPQLVKSTDFYPLLLFHECANVTVKQSLGKIKLDFRGLGEHVKGRDAQVIFSSILQVRERDAGGN